MFNALALALFVSPAAAAVSPYSVTMTRQDKDADTSFDIEFTTVTAVNASTDTITVTFQSGFDLTGVLFSDVDLEDDTVDKTVAAAPAAGTWGFGNAGQVLTFTAPTDAGATEIVAGSVVNIKVGTLASGPGVNEVDNPSSVGAYTVVIGGTFGDSGTAYVPILDDDFVTISATVQSNIWFDLDIDDDDTTLHHDESAAPYEVDLGTLIFTTVTDENTGGVDEIYLDLSTNASGGAVVEFYSVNTSLDSSSSGGSIVSATETLTANTTDGGYGVDADLVGGGEDSGGPFVITAPYNAGASPAVVAVPSAWDTIFDSSGAAVQGGDGRINVRAISGTETPAANDYTDTLYFRATATF